MLDVSGKRKRKVPPSDGAWEINFSINVINMLVMYNSTSYVDTSGRWNIKQVGNQTGWRQEDRYTTMRQEKGYFLRHDFFLVGTNRLI